MHSACGETCRLGLDPCYAGCVWPIGCERLDEPGIEAIIRERSTRLKPGTKRTVLHEPDAIFRRPPIRDWDPSGPIKVGVCTSGLQIGGADRWVLDLLAVASEPPFAVAGTGALQPNIRHPSIVERAAARGPVEWTSEGITKIAQQADVIVSWGVPNLHALLPDPGPRTVLVAHNVTDDDWTVSSLRDASQATACVACAKAACECYPESERNRCTVIYSTAPEPPRIIHRWPVRDAWGVPRDAKVFGFLGRMAAQKYPEGLAKAIKHLPPEWVGVYVGPLDGPDSASCLEQIKAVGVDDRLYFPGPTDDPYSALAAFDEMYLASKFEGHSVAMTEALMLGVPIIATRVAFTEEYPEFIREVPQLDDGRAIAAAVLADTEDPRGTADRVARARIFAMSHLSFTRFRREWRSFLASAMGPEAIERLKQTDGPDLSGPFMPVVAQPEPPSFGRKVFNFGKAVVQHIATGAELADNVTAEARLAVCRGCELFDAAAETCKNCGCSMPRKVRWKEQRCPLGKWPTLAA